MKHTPFMMIEIDVSSCAALGRMAPTDAGKPGRPRPAAGDARAASFGDTLFHAKAILVYFTEDWQVKPIFAVRAKMTRFFAFLARAGRNSGENRPRRR